MSKWQGDRNTAQDLSGIIIWKIFSHLAYLNTGSSNTGSTMFLPFPTSLWGIRYFQFLLRRNQFFEISSSTSLLFLLHNTYRMWAWRLSSQVCSMFTSVWLNVRKRACCLSLTQARWWVTWLFSQGSPSSSLSELTETAPSSPYPRLTSMSRIKLTHKTFHFFVV